MGLFSRLGNILDSNLTSILDRAEDPEVTLAQAIREMEDTLTEVRAGTVRLIADRKGAAAKWREAEFEMLDWERKAELALSHGREDLAKAALVAKDRIRRAAEPAKGELDAVESAIAKLSEDAARLEAKLAEAVTKRRALLARHRAASDRLRVRTTLHDGRIDDAIAAASALDRHLDRMEARADVMGMGRAPRGLADEIEDLEAEQRVTEELERLRARVAKAS